MQYTGTNITDTLVWKYMYHYENGTQIPLYRRQNVASVPISLIKWYKRTKFTDKMVQKYQYHRQTVTKVPIYQTVTKMPISRINRYKSTNINVEILQIKFSKNTDNTVGYKSTNITDRFVQKYQYHR